MQVKKQTEIGLGCVVDSDDLERINRLTRKKLTAEEVYVFGVRLCDNEIDRDGERFPEETLKELGELFVGKSGLFDHEWSAKGQNARIYRTEVVREEGCVTAMGDAACYLKGYAYMLRTESNRDLIAEIEGGIKKEVSVGCAVSSRVCSICGGDPEMCGHVLGETYEGKRCCAELIGATDAYEWSFVAVPAQRKAGVVKSMESGMDWEKLRAEAAMGRRYLAALRQEVVRLGCMTQNGPDTNVLRSMAEKLDESELLTLKQTLEAQMQKKYPMEPQLTYFKQAEETDWDGAFRI